MKHLIVVVALVACGKADKDKAEDTAGSAAVSGSGTGTSMVSGSGSGSDAGSAAGSSAGSAAGSSAGSAAGPGAGSPTDPGAAWATATVPTPTPGGLHGKEPPTAESLHVELAYALARWRANPRDPAIYAKDFGGRAEPDGRVKPVNYDAWMKLLPPSPARTKNPTIKTWLDAGSGLAEGESQVHVSYFYDKKDEYRELLFRREGGTQLLVREKTNSRSGRDEFLDMRIFTIIDASKLGATLTARFGVDGPFAWLVVEDDKGAQVVVDLWPGGPCKEEAAPEPALALLRCADGGDGKDFTLEHDRDRLVFRLRPAGKQSPMSTDRAITLAKGAKVTFAATIPSP